MRAVTVEELRAAFERASRNISDTTWHYWTARWLAELEDLTSASSEQPWCAEPPTQQSLAMPATDGEVTVKANDVSDQGSALPEEPPERSATGEGEGPLAVVGHFSCDGER